MSVDLNSASLQELAALPGVGPQGAYELTLWRPFLTWDQVASLPGLEVLDVAALRAAGAVIGPPKVDRWMLGADTAAS
jgi:DNA uptake protein ComE-like DNA-binding protein